MFSKIWSALGIARHAVALVILTGATTGLVASSLDANASRAAATSEAAAVNAAIATRVYTSAAELDVLTRMCLEMKDADSDVCAEAIEKSGLTASEFWAKLAISLNQQVRKHEQEQKQPKVNTSELLGLVNACVASHERSTEPCAKALELSGLTADEFWAKVYALFSKSTEAPKTEPKTTERPTTTEKPTTSPKSNTEIYAQIRECQAAYEMARQGQTTSVTVGQICAKAIEASGLSANDFWAKYSPKPATTPTATAKPTATPTARPQSVSDADLLSLVRDCFTKYNAATASKGNEDLGRSAYEACTKAITASGLVADAFWAKFGTPQSPKI